MRILAIETSCDDTAICLADAGGKLGPNFRFSVLGNAIFSQTEHALYGGVFPNLAKREHQKNLVPLLEKVLKSADDLTPHKTPYRPTRSVEIEKILEREPELKMQLRSFAEKYGRPEVDAIAVTVGPGLEPALWTGINFARALGAAWDLPIIAVNHMEGHFLVSLGKLEGERLLIPKFEFPVLGLLISGGHTELVLSRELLKYEIIGRTRDDAVGEAFDKVARMLGLPYPGGPHISALAEAFRKSDEMTSHRISLPRPMLHSGDLDFSFAGLKTAVKKIVDENSPLDSRTKEEIAREFEDSVTEVLLSKTLEAIEKFSVNTFALGGGVSANLHIRRVFAQKLAEQGVECFISEKSLTTDNAVMIALAGYMHSSEARSGAADLKADGQLKLG